MSPCIGVFCGSAVGRGIDYSAAAKAFAIALVRRGMGVVYETMHERKAGMAALADAFVALPGGLGTLEELFEAWTWAHLGLHSKRCALLNTGGYYDPLIEFLDHAVHEGFVREGQRSSLVVAADPDELLDTLFPSS